MRDIAGVAVEQPKKNEVARCDFELPKEPA